MTSNDTATNDPIEIYLSENYQRYSAWYEQQAAIAKNNMIAGAVVVAVCCLCLVFFPESMDQMRFFQYHFDPTNAIKIGLLAAIVLAFVSMYPSVKQMRRSMALHAQLQSEFTAFQNRRHGKNKTDLKTEFDDFKQSVEAIMAASNPDVVRAIELDNSTKRESQ